MHAVLDGRDVPPRSALTYLQELEEKLQQIGTGKVATLSGRYYTMDRDKRWERVEKAYRCLTEGVGLEAKTAREAVENGYKRGENDEFLQPTLVDREGLVRTGIASYSSISGRTEPVRSPGPSLIRIFRALPQSRCGFFTPA